MNRSTRTYDLYAEVTFDIAEGVNLTHWVNPDTGKLEHRMDGLYANVQTEDDVYKHLAYNAVFNGVMDASRLDGWADLEADQIRMHVDGSIE
jgi:hypothetical protein